LKTKESTPDSHPEQLSTDKTRWLEIIAALITGLGKLVFINWLEWRLIYIIGACLFWGIYVYRRYKKNPGILKYWGFTFHNFGKTLKLLLPFGIISLLAFFIIGHYQGSNILSWRIIPLLFLYPLWGIIQQFLVIGLFAGNLKDMQQNHLPETLIILLTAFVFGIVHYPHLLLVGGTFLLAMCYTFVYMRHRNLYVLGIFHGWLGAFFYYVVLGRDAYLEVFGSLL